MKVTANYPPAWLVTTTAAGLLAVYAALLIVPGQRLLGQRCSELREKRAFIAKVREESAGLTELEGQLERTLRHIQAWRQASPRDSNLSDFLAKLANIAGQSGVRMNRLTPQPHVAMAAVRQHPLALELEGDFAQLVDFLGCLEQLPETVWIRHLQLTPHRQNRTTAACEVILTVFADNREISG